MSGQAGSEQQVVVSGWVWDTNVRALVESVATLVGYRFDDWDWDWDAISSALPGTDADDHAGWYRYPLIGTVALEVELAQEPGGSVTSIRIRQPADPLLQARIETVVAMLSVYRVLLHDPAADPKPGSA